MRRISGTPMRLAISLRPLTPVLPPTWSESGPRDDIKLSLPPSFTVVSFPCDLKPFVVPLTWAYAAAHSFSKNQKVSSIINPDAGKVQVREFSSLDDASGSMRLDDKIPFVRALVSHWNSAVTTRHCLGEDLSNSLHTLPRRDTRVVHSIWKDYLEFSGNSEGEEEDRCIDMVDLIRSTLPLWESVSATSNAHIGARVHFSPWELVPLGKARLWSTEIRPLPLDDSIRDKIEFVIENAIAEDASAGLFEHPVTDEDAPSYSCAAPIGMSLSRILERLNGGRGAHDCYYRGIGNIYADITTILDNCLLYNSPESPVVDAAVEVVTKLKESIAKLAQSHFREVSEARKIDEERHHHVYCQFSPGTEESQAANSRQAVITTLKTPFKDTIYRGWLLPRPAHHVGAQESCWVPQAGDTILYSRSRHTHFVKHHYPSLKTEQCVILNDSDNSEAGSASSDDNSDWVPVSVLWTRPVFPKALSKGSGEDANTFKESALLLALGVKLPTDTVGVVYWRPCTLPGDHPQGDDSSCLCGMSIEESFVRAVDGGQLETETTCEMIGTLSSESREMISLILSFLKRRCLNEVHPCYVENELTKASIKRGFKPAQTKGRLRNLPRYDHLLSMSFDHLPNARETRGLPRKSLVDDSARDRLSDCGFLPKWSKGATTRATQELDICAAVMPLPELSIELVQMRLRKGYYRHVAAIENDLIESFVTAVVLLIKESVSRKKSPLSMKRIARALGLNKESVNASTEESADEPAPAAVFEQESQLADNLRLVRDLYATALVATSHTGHMAALFGLVQPVEISLEALRASDLEQDPVRAEARQKLACLLIAVGKDRARNTFPSKNLTSESLPTMRLKITCGGEIVSHRKQVMRIDHCTADWNDETVKVKFISGNKVVPFLRKIDPEVLPLSGKKSAKREIKHIVETSVAIKPSDFEGGGALAPFFFGRPGRMEPCARCQAYKRSFLACRVKKEHSNIDFDWVSAFKGVGGVDGLIHALHPESGPSTSANSEDTVQPPFSNDQDDDAPDPTDILAKAEEALELARTFHGVAAECADGPARLGKDFVQTNFPIDSSDGHFIYCVICGLSGDLICCDGCPNVLHSQCISLDEIPEGEWFCEECEIEGRSGQKKSSNTLVDGASPNAGPEKSHRNILPFGRVKVDERKTKELASRVKSLQAARPERQKRNEVRVEDAIRNAPDAEDEESLDGDSSTAVSLVQAARRKKLQEYSSPDESMRGKQSRRQRARRISQKNASVGESDNDDHPEEKMPLRRTRGVSVSKKRLREKAGSDDESERDEQPKLKKPRGRPRKLPPTRKKLRGSADESDDPEQPKLKTPRGRMQKGRASRFRNERSIDDESEDYEKHKQTTPRGRGKRLRSEPSVDDESKSSEQRRPRRRASTTRERVRNEASNNDESEDSEQPERITPRSKAQKVHATRKGLRNGANKKDKSEDSEQPEQITPRSKAQKVHATRKGLRNGANKKDESEDSEQLEQSTPRSKAQKVYATRKGLRNGSDKKDDSEDPEEPEQSTPHSKAQKVHATRKGLRNGPNKKDKSEDLEEPEQSTPRSKAQNVHSTRKGRANKKDESVDPEEPEQSTPHSKTQKVHATRKGLRNGANKKDESEDPEEPEQSTPRSKAQNVHSTRKGRGNKKDESVDPEEPEQSTPHSKTQKVLATRKGLRNGANKKDESEDPEEPEQSTPRSKAQKVHATRKGLRNGANKSEDPEQLEQKTTRGRTQKVHATRKSPVRASQVSPAARDSPPKNGQPVLQRTRSRSRKRPGPTA
jgi:hypothetical protein